MFVYFAPISHIIHTAYNSNRHYNMNNDTKKELLAAIEELLYLGNTGHDLFQQFDDLLLDYGYDGDPQELLFELM